MSSILLYEKLIYKVGDLYGTYKYKTYFYLIRRLYKCIFASLNQNIYSPIIPLIKDSFDVSTTLVNLSVSLFIFITAIMQIVYGLFLILKEVALFFSLVLCLPYWLVLVVLLQVTLRCFSFFDLCKPSEQQLFH